MPPKKTWFELNKWWIAPVIGFLGIAIPWLINYGADQQEQKDWRRNIQFRISSDSFNIMLIFDTLDMHRDRFDKLKSSSYRKTNDD